MANGTTATATRNLDGFMDDDYSTGRVASLFLTVESDTMRMYTGDTAYTVVESISDIVAVLNRAGTQEFNMSSSVDGAAYETSNASVIALALEVCGA